MLKTIARHRIFNHSQITNHPLNMGWMRRLYVHVALPTTRVAQRPKFELERNQVPQHCDWLWAYLGALA